MIEDLIALSEFEWDEGNRGKNLKRHGVTDTECEEVFFDPEKKIFKDIKHSRQEKRYILLGRTRFQRLLLVVFTVRNDRMRIISARDLNKKEIYLYEKKS